MGNREMMRQSIQAFNPPEALAGGVQGSLR
jgi:hypothetical protein